LLDPSSLHDVAIAGGGVVGGPSSTTASKRRFVGSMDDMGDFMSSAHEMTSPRLSHESHFVDEEDVNGIVGGKTYNPHHHHHDHHHHHHHHHGSHVLDDSVVSKDVEPIVTAPPMGMGEEDAPVMIPMPSQVIAPTTANLVNPAEIMSGGGGFESWTDSAHHNLVEAAWPEATPMASAYETTSSYF